MFATRLAASVDRRDGAAERPPGIADPFVRDFPGDEVPAVVVRGDVDVVVPGAAIAGQKVLHSLIVAGNAGRVLVADEGDPGRCLDARPAVMFGLPWVPVVVGVRPDRAGDALPGPEDRGVREQVV